MTLNLKSNESKVTWPNFQNFVEEFTDFGLHLPHTHGARLSVVASDWRRLLSRKKLAMFLVNFSPMLFLVTTKVYKSLIIVFNLFLFTVVDLGCNKCTFDRTHIVSFTMATTGCDAARSDLSDKCV